jgi:hypothetical protein
MTTDTLTQVSLEQRDYHGWPAYFLRRGDLELAITPSIGGRIMRAAWRGHDLAYSNPSYHGRALNLHNFPDPRAAKREFGLRRYGGDHTWLAPQSRWSDGLPFLDLDSGPYTAEVEESTEHDVRLTVTSPVDRETGMQIVRTVRLSAARAGFEVTHTLRNVSGKLAQWAIWDVFHLRRPGRVYLPRRKGSRFPAGVKSFDGAGSSLEARDAALKTAGPIAIVDCSTEASFKLGVDADQGWVLALQPSDLPLPELAPMPEPPASLAGRPIETAASAETGESAASESGDGAAATDASATALPPAASGNGAPRPRVSLVGYASAYEVFGRRPYGSGCTAEVSNLGAASPSFAIEVHGALALLAPGQQTQLVEQRLLFAADAWPENEEQIRTLLLNASL